MNIVIDLGPLLPALEMALGNPLKRHRLPVEQPFQAVVVVQAKPRAHHRGNTLSTRLHKPQP